MKSRMALIIVLLFSARLSAQFMSGLSFDSKIDYERTSLALTASVPNFNMNRVRSVDLSSYMPPVKNQGRQNSCTAWAVAYGCRSFYNYYYSPQNFNTDSLGAYQLALSPSFIYNSLNGGNAQATLSLRMVLDFMKAYGSCSINRMPYAASSVNKPTTEQKLHALAGRIDSYRRLNLQNTVAAIKAQLLLRNPVIVGVRLDNYFLCNRNTSSGCCVNNAYDPENATIAHAMVVTGFDDDSRSFKVMNSWGSSWGCNGYGLISYDIAPTVIREAYILKPFVGYKQFLVELGGGAAYPHNEWQSFSSLLYDSIMANTNMEISSSEYEDWNMEMELYPKFNLSSEKLKQPKELQFNGHISLPNVLLTMNLSMNSDETELTSSHFVAVRFFYDSSDNFLQYPVLCEQDSFRTPEGELISNTIPIVDPNSSLEFELVHQNFTIAIPRALLKKKQGGADVKLVALPILFIESFPLRIGSPLHFSL